MTATWPRRAVAVWGVLVVVTAATFWLGTDHPFSGVGPRFATGLALAAAFVKAWLVGQHFMEIREAPVALRLVFGAWVLVFGTICTLLYVL